MDPGLSVFLPGIKVGSHLYFISSAVAEGGRLDDYQVSILFG